MKHFTLAICCFVASFSGCLGHPVGEAANEITKTAVSATDFVANLLVTPEKSREDAKLETEAFPSSIQGLYDSTQEKAINIIDAKPIIDTIAEEDKYGNTGDMFDGVARAVVNGYEAFSNFMNKLIAAPSSVFKSVSRSLNESLDLIGAKIVGLA